jgi:protein-disulfide isomerase
MKPLTSRPPPQEQPDLFDPAGISYGMQASVDTSHLLLPIREEDHVQGPSDAPLTLVEYGDYECLACGQLFVILRDLQETLGARLRIVYRHYPRSGAHPHAQGAAEAAEAAGAQGKFWEMHDLLFQNQGNLKQKDLLAYAERLGLDMDRFRAELTGSVYQDRVRGDFRHGVQNGVYGTPGLFLNGVRYDGAWDEATLIKELTT